MNSRVIKIGKSAETINLLDITPSEWDVVYSFEPYTSEDTVYEEVGYKWDDIMDTVSEGMSQLVFLNDGKEVCYISVYFATNGYGLSFATGKNPKVK